MRKIIHLAAVRERYFAVIYVCNDSSAAAKLTEKHFVNKRCGNFFFYGAAKVTRPELAGITGFGKVLLAFGSNGKPHFFCRKTARKFFAFL